MTKVLEQSLPALSGQPVALVGSGLVDVAINVEVGCGYGGVTDKGSKKNIKRTQKRLKKGYMDSFTPSMDES